jgi:colicin import membrane protein
LGLQPQAAALRKQQEAEAARIAAAQRELDERQRKIEEAEAKAKAEAEAARIAEAKAKTVKPIRKGKAIDPLADLKQALSANPATAKALDQAYQRGFQAGMNSAQQAA